MLQRGWRRECRQQDSFTKRHNFHPPPLYQKVNNPDLTEKQRNKSGDRKLVDVEKKVSKDVYSRLANTRQVLELLKTSA